MKKKLISMAFALALIVPLEAETPSFREKATAFCKKAVAIVKDCSLAYVIAMVSTIAHESGHNMAQYACHGRSYGITIGGLSSEDPAYFTIPYPTVRICSFNPFIGSCPVERDYSTKNGCLSSMVIAIAGPLLGIASSFIALKLLNKYAPKKYHFSRGMCYFSALENGLQMRPDDRGNDGQLFYDSYKAYKEHQELPEQQMLSFEKV